jgi:serine protease Do
LELKNALTGVAPGTKISLLIKANGGEQKIEVTLGNRPQLPQYANGRLEQMERMGGPVSQVRDSFTHVIQTDMRPKPNQVGGPVVDLQGRVMGITMARADRTRSFVMPSAAVVDLLKKEAGNPALAQVRAEEKEVPTTPRGNAKRGRATPSGEDRMRRHLSDMQRLMEHLQLEMQALEEP